MQLRGIPVLAVLIALLGVAMLPPAVMAVMQGDEKLARAFFFPGLFVVVVAGLAGLALQRPAHRSTPREEITAFVVAWLILPALAAIPIRIATPVLGTSGAVFEMVAAMTTTGGTAYGNLDVVAGPIHLWRGLVAWIGGFIILMAAHAVLAPRNLGGVEVRGSSIAVGDGATGLAGAASAEQRFARAWRVIAPVYIGFTGLAIFLLSLSGQSGLDAAVHGMSILSTSGVSPRQDGFAGAGGPGGEVVAAVLMLLAATRLTFDPNRRWPAIRALAADAEVKLMLSLVFAATLVLFLRHWVGVLTIDAEAAAAEGGAALWGAFFASVSFITTTGFESESWSAARSWSGLENPGLILLALCAIGGGAATTAGGVKLIRVHVLAQQCMREITRLSQPMSISHDSPSISTGRTRGERREGALIAWAFAMLFLGSVIIATIWLTLCGLNFDQALVAALAGLSNTGQAFTVIAGHSEGFSVLGTGAKMVMIVTMIVGRVETLALIALFNPDRWR